MGIERKLSERSVDYVLYFTRYYWDSGDFLGADVIEAAHRLQRVGQLARMRWARICHMMRMQADRTKRMILCRRNEGAARRLLPEGTSRGHNAIEVRHIVRRNIRE